MINFCIEKLLEVDIMVILNTINTTNDVMVISYPMFWLIPDIIKYVLF